SSSAGALRTENVGWVEPFARPNADLETDFCWVPQGLDPTYIKPTSNRRLFDGRIGVERRGAEPGVIGDVEHHLVGAVELGLVETLLAFRTAREALGAELFELL